MKVYVERPLGQRIVNVYVFEQAGLRKGMQVMWRGNGLLENVEVEQGMVTEPSLVLPEDVLEEIVAQSQGVLPPAAAVDRHLKDAMAIRDRLLAMVEKSHE